MKPYLLVLLLLFVGCEGKERPLNHAGNKYVAGWGIERKIWNDTGVVYRDTIQATYETYDSLMADFSWADFREKIN